MLVIALAVFLPCSLSAVDRVKANTGMGADWHDALVWLRANTPEPLPNATYTEVVSANYTYPDSAYGVLSWWDYGYFITYIAHRIPNANPGGMGYKDAGMFFTSGNESEANGILNKLGSRYIIIDQAMASGKFYAMAIWANRAPGDYMDVYYYKDEAGLYQPVMLYYPAYYETICSRLYNFNGQATTPTKVLAVSWQPNQASTSATRLITDVKSFDTYDTAKQFVASNPKYIIASDNPSSTPVPLKSLGNYSLVHSASTIKVFEYIAEGEAP
jgi:dolichyl-diphosphooligosaccharide--protein glycosyltransferase